MTALDSPRQRLSDFADDCEAWARLSCTADARGLFHRIAADARETARGRYLGEEGFRLALEAAKAQAAFAAWHSGAVDVAPEWGRVASDRAVPHANAPGVRLRPLRPPGALNACRLAELYGMNERSARRAIERGACSGLPGFYRDGCHWFAEPQAFERARRGVVSELCPKAAPAVHSGP
ncbi:MAG TPA: hypothetical protein VMN38_11750 [Sphingomicrobium sp.]|nr:hypothetical protein [Sphingomicrobium sp.]